MKSITHLNNKKFIIPVLLLLLLGILEIISPIIINNEKANWENVVKEKVQSSEDLIRDEFSRRIDVLVDNKDYIRQKIKNEISGEVRFSIFKILSDIKEKNYLIQIYGPDSSLVYWDKNEFGNDTDLKKYFNRPGQVIFDNYKLITCLSVCDSFTIKNKKYFIALSSQVDSRFNHGKQRNSSENLTEYFANILGTSVNINYDAYSKIVLDGRFHSFALLNNFGNKIGTVEFEKPALDSEIYNLENLFKAVRSILFVLIYISLSVAISQKLKKDKTVYRFLEFAIFAALLRIILFLTGIPSDFFENELTDASNFSSRFAFGMVRSPMEFTITAVISFLIIIHGFKLFLKRFAEKKRNNKNWFVFSLSSLLGFILVLLGLRGLGASLRSVVFDSSIRYFREFDLIPDAPTFLMDFNILTLGVSVFLLSLMVLLFVFSFTPAESSRKKIILYGILFIALQISGLIFDSVQKEPQGTPSIRFLFITILFVLAYFLIFRNYRSILKYLYIALGASIATVSLLTYYNSEIEREYLKTTAQDLTRSNENIYKFMIYQTLLSIQNESFVNESFVNQKDFNTLAFVEWTKSLLFKETVPVALTFYNIDRKKIGSFATSSFENNIENNSQLPANSEVPVVDVYPGGFDKQVKISGIAAIKNQNKIIGYAIIEVLYDKSYFNFSDRPKFLTIEKSGVSSAVNPERLKIFYFQNGELLRSFGSVQLSDNIIRRITKHKFSEQNEYWIKINIAGENYLFYLLNLGGDDSRILAVAKENRNYSWNLSDFFKVFFIHVVIILAAFFIIALLNFKKMKMFWESYKTKLAAAFVIVSVIPLVIVAIYYKSIGDNKNDELIFSRLNENVNRIEHYFAVNSLVKPEELFNRAAKELDLNYSVYSDKKIIYSSKEHFYNAGLLCELIPVKVWYDLFNAGLEKTEIKTPGSEENIYAVYLKSKLGKDNLVIEINSQFNSASLPFSDIDVNIFMFGTLSLAVIMLIIFSTILAEQISAPIRKLTNATRSLGSGDLNIEIPEIYSGEIAELTSGFNMMVKRLKKSQIEMAQLERETAWKEMAKQVAHEIKNPLTPMKLSVQQLIAAYKDKSPKFDAIFEKVTLTIITQIETLKNIASEFSNFARMPKLNIERINLIGCVKEAINLFANENLQIRAEYNKDEIIINADYGHLNRTLINLFRNSVQASAKNIMINISIENGMCFIKLLDDGKGIEKENVEKIFEDNFTTKSGGMGLGLSMAKKFLENIGGNILVEKTSAEGTAFIITIPLSE
jgi:two-component system, NtrC family, nitrogen regulation sensor histidine kinase NtrY